VPYPRTPEDGADDFPPSGADLDAPLNSQPSTPTRRSIDPKTSASDEEAKSPTTRPPTKKEKGKGREVSTPARATPPPKVEGPPFDVPSVLDPYRLAQFASAVAADDLRASIPYVHGTIEIVAPVRPSSSSIVDVQLTFASVRRAWRRRRGAASRRAPSQLPAIVALAWVARASGEASPTSAPRARRWPSSSRPYRSPGSPASWRSGLAPLGGNAEPRPSRTPRSPSPVALRTPTPRRPRRERTSSGNPRTCSTDGQSAMTV
jgi:hypothetical protein